MTLLKPCLAAACFAPQSSLLETLCCLLQVPARKVANLELLLTQDKAPRHKALSSVEEDAWARRMRYLKARPAGPVGC